MSIRDKNKAAIEKVLIKFQEKHVPREVDSLAEEIADALPNQAELIVKALKIILPEEVYDEWAITIAFYGLLAGVDVFSAS